MRSRGCIPSCAFIYCTRKFDLQSDPMKAFSMTIRFPLELSQVIQHIGSNGEIPGMGIGLVASVSRSRAHKGFYVGLAIMAFTRRLRASRRPTRKLDRATWKT